MWKLNDNEAAKGSDITYLATLVLISVAVMEPLIYKKEHTR